jgi:hypothetical protein
MANGSTSPQMQAGPNLLRQIWKINPSSGTAMQVTRGSIRLKNGDLRSLIMMARPSTTSATIGYGRWTSSRMSRSAVPEMADIFLNRNWGGGGGGDLLLPDYRVLYGRSMIVRLDQQTWKTTLFGTMGRRDGR